MDSYGLRLRFHLLFQSLRLRPMQLRAKHHAIFTIALDFFT